MVDIAKPLFGLELAQAQEDLSLANRELARISQRTRVLDGITILANCGQPATPMASRHFIPTSTPCSTRKPWTAW